jgi:hypothetical protein
MRAIKISSLKIGAFVKERKLGKYLKLLVVSVCFSFGVGAGVWGWLNYQMYVEGGKEREALEEKLNQIEGELVELQNQDQVKINIELKEEIENINETYKATVSAYERILMLEEKEEAEGEYWELLADILTLLSERKYEEGSEKLTELAEKVAKKEESLLVASAPEVSSSVPSSNAPPGGGYSRQNVSTSAGNFMVSIVAADLGSTRVIVDTASGGDCSNNCPVLSLGEYVSRNGAWAGVNGSYFCPATYPSCAGKTNTFDLLVMNKDKVYFNSANNVYSTNPAVIFGSGWIRFVGQVLEWGRDTGIDSMLSNYPLLVSGGNVSFGGDGDPKKGSRGNRSFVANKGNTVYIGVVHGATVSESALVMNSLGMENALNLDNGGSTALWHGGYKVGPGRNLPNVILFVGK